MLSYQIKGVQDGMLHAEKDGLYWIIRADCSRDWDHPIRLIADHDGAKTTLGVPMPEQNRLRLETRISDRAFHFTQQTQIQTDQYQPPLEPFVPSEPFDRISEFSVMHVVEQDDKPYWQKPE